MDKYPSIFNRSKFGHYICVCQTWFNKDEREEALDHFYSGSIDGYCVNGLKRLDLTNDIHKDTYECVCGVQADRYDISENHFRIHGKSCMTARIRKDESYCEICDLQCSSVCDYIKHCGTKKHKKRKHSPKLTSLECNVCNIKCISEIHMNRHLQTKKHQSMVASGQVAEEKLPLTCDICNITCPSQKTIRAHLQTKKHLKKMDLLANI